MLFLAAVIPTCPQANISTDRYDNSRTGANLNETVLATSNVGPGQFGKLYTYVADGSVQASPLYVSNLAIPGRGTHNVLFVVTMNDVVYALDADSNAANGGILWKVDFRNPSAGVSPIPIVDIVNNNTLNIVGNVGIESTPVIDLSSSTMYLVARTKEVSGAVTRYVARLHALDIATGNEKFGGPVIIQGSVPGNGQGSVGGTLTFDPLIHNQRSSLALANGLVVFSWASHEDQWAWHGWVFAYNAQTLQQASIFCATPNGQNGGIWMSGRAPAVDSAGNLYYASGNGDWDGVSNFGDSIVKLATTGGTLSLVDYFTPDDYAVLETSDLDLGSSGPLLISGTNLLVHGGKEPIFFVMRTTNLGHEQAGNNQIVQNFPVTGRNIHSGPVFWNRTTDAGPTLYVWPENTTLQAFQFNGSIFSTTPISQSTIVAPSGHSAGVLTLSANGSTPGSGIIWASMPINEDSDHGVHAGLLRAFDANNLSTELWDSEMNSSRDALGNWPKFSSPTVANGRVYMASFPSDGVSTTAISIYGLLTDFSISASPSSNSVVPGGTVSYSVNTTATAGFSGSITLSASGLPTGATASFSPATVTGTGSSTLTVITTGSTRVGTSTLPVTGAATSVLALTSLLTMLGWAANRERRGQRLQPPTFPGLCVAAALLALCWGCGGNSNASASGGTSIGTYRLLVTGSSGNISHSTALSLTVK